ncbi:AtpZ/AtpI family protein [Lyngbya confervoides]|uniref:AtpZ/AtpI family protein n=1 Tax=Lyngbya confervoides BDU141951 TaxID=1574623 RepID=A0ABD4T8N3_9CYAN|nr:AtpZ/AtpI family protein [Lyngbya confervoides]MCM1984937.1 AtpZ/AtpI family protein [Lyngbya confervoides BDU141951]
MSQFPSRPPDEDSFQQTVTHKADRKHRARQGRKRVWFGLGLFGLVGWSVTIPTLLGLALGRWLDHHLPSRYSWTLMLLVLGIGLGCWNAWYWIQKESRHE